MIKKIIMITLILLTTITLVACQSDELADENRQLTEQVTELNERIDELLEQISTLEAQSAEDRVLISEFEAKLTDLAGILTNVDVSAIEGITELIETIRSNISQLQHRLNNTVFVYFTFGTMPTLFASLHFLSHQLPVYAFWQRENTLDRDQMPDNVTVVGTGWSSPREFAQLALSTVEYLEEKYNQPNFVFFVDDLRVLLAYYALIRGGIPTERFRITLLADGSGSNNLFGNFQGVDGIEEWNERKNAFENVWLPMFDSDVQLTDQQYGWVWDNRHFAPIAAQRPYVEYWLQFPEVPFFNDNISMAVRAELVRANLRKTVPFSLLNQLSIRARATFFNATINNPDFAISEEETLFDYLSNVFSDQKPIMIVSGTHTGEGVSPTGFIGALEEIIAEFGDDYVIMYKPHPAWNINHQGNANLVEFLAENEIRILPPRLPMEVILWAFPDVVIGGYSSTLFLAAGPNQVLFSIGSFAGTDHVLAFLMDLGFFPNLKFQF